MENSIKEILNQLDKGDIKHKEAIKLMKMININTNTVKKKASRLKITVIDEEQSIKIPAIPFGLITFLIDIGFGLSSIALRFVDDFDEDVKRILDSIDRKDIKQVFSELRKHGPFDLVDVQDGDNTEVKITIL
ncbi:DUF2089 domain-containing protein [Clostridium sp. Cult2]|uniref:DUF2089 domain-containing protein n=1 Tax=Clostridium sp. Cult2 TaxID=2079003 RepID=UPI001F374CB6|nr:DUF2089 domain-containing protein [Clostridium sp. Cult2]MCF6466145.1 hypothetical protein [Clostridium sp. Cult2]